MEGIGERVPKIPAWALLRRVALHVVWVPSHVLFAVWGATRIRRVLIRTVAGVQTTSVYKRPTMKLWCSVTINQLSELRKQQVHKTTCLWRCE